jgi:hypothetical protein
MPETKKRATARKRANSSKPKSKSKTSRASTNGGGNSADSLRHTVEDKAKTAGQAAGSAVSKAKVPLIAGGAALAGAAGGLALATRQEHRRHGLVRAMGKPKLRLTSRDVAKAAKEVGNFSAQMGELATELRRAREETGNGKRRSPVEVVLDGLTARR